MAGGNSFSTQEILSWGDWVQVCRIHAGPIPAQVIQVESFWDLPNKEAIT